MVETKIFLVQQFMLYLHEILLFVINIKIRSDSKMFCMGDYQRENVVEDSTAKKIENYIFKYEDLLGKGNFGAAYRGYDVNSGKQVAIKVIKMASIKSKVSEKLLENEIQILRSIGNHQNLLKCYDVFTSVNNCYIITELCDYDLQQELKNKGRFQQYEIRSLIYGIYKGLEQLSKNGIIHRDIKISNIFLTKKKVPKIADFGFAIKSNNKFKDLNIGSPLYMSPQGLLHNMYGPKTDVWSFGVLLYQLLHGETPLERCTSDEQLKFQILQPPKFLTSISSQLRQVIEACLTVDESKRPNIFQLANLPFIRKLINQFQPRNYPLKQSSHESTECSEQSSRYISLPSLVGAEISYDIGVGLLHYCRLLHKSNKKVIRSQKLSQFLLNLSYSLTKCNISSIQAFNQQRNKLRQVLHEYHNKFLLEHEDSKAKISPRQALIELENMKRNQHYIHAINVIEALWEETRILVLALDHHNLQIFIKSSQSKSILQSNRLDI